MHTERMNELLRMAEHIRDTPLCDERGVPVGFNMATFGITSSCGTAACMLGHVLFWPTFKADGWQKSKSRDEYNWAPQWDRAVGWGTGLSAAEDYFEIDYRQAQYMFMDYPVDLHKVALDHVIDRIKGVIAGHDGDDTDEEGRDRYGSE